MNTRAQLDPTMTPSTHPIERMTASQYVDSVVDQYRRSTYTEDLTCKRLARLGLMRDLNVTYRQACNLLP